jgi:predicted nucleic acid-binding protein
LEDEEAGELLIFLLDTNVVSELRKIRPHGAALNWYRSYPESAFAIPALALYEIQEGIEITRGKTWQKRQKLNAGSTQFSPQQQSCRWTEMLQGSRHK